MRILLDVGKADVDAVVNLVDGYGRTPLDMAHKWHQNSTEMIALLKSKGAKWASELPRPST
tara:strand:- start:216 stop:398 length:183 start_codon:yes stop_codon:yes gene_type:complete